MDGLRVPLGAPPDHGLHVLGPRGEEAGRCVVPGLVRTVPTVAGHDHGGDGDAECPHEHGDLDGDVGHQHHGPRPADPGGHGGHPVPITPVPQRCPVQHAAGLMVVASRRVVRRKGHPPLRRPVGWARRAS